MPPIFRIVCCVLCALLLGCDREDGANERGPEAKAVVEIVPSGSVDQLESPAGVLAFGGFRRDGLDRLGKALGGSAPLVPSAESLATTVQQALRLSDASVLDLSKPPRFVVIDPKKHASPALVAVATLGRDKMVAALPADKRSNDGGNAFGYDVDGQPLYLNFVDEYAVMSHAAGAFAEQREFLRKLLGATLDSEAVVVISVKNARALFGPEIDDSVAAAKIELEKSGKLPAASVKQAARALDWLTSVMGDVDRVVLRASVPADGLRVEAAVQARAESELGRAFARLDARPLGVLAKLPPETPLAFAMSVDPGGDGMGRAMLRASMELALGGLELGDEYAQALEQFWLASEGQMAFAAHPLAGSDKLAFSGIVPLKDPEKARSAMDALQKMYADKQVTDRFAASGIDVSLKKSAYRIGETPVDVVSAKTKAGSEAARLGAMGGAQLAELLDTHQAVSEHMVLFAHGADAKKTLEAWLGGKVPGGLDGTAGLTRALQTAAPSTFALLYVSPGELLRRMLPGKLGAGAGAPTHSGIALTAGSREGALVLVADLPAEQALALMQFVLQPR